MKDELFTEMIASLKEGGAILRDEKKYHAHSISIPWILGTSAKTII